MHLPDTGIISSTGRGMVVGDTNETFHTTTTNRHATYIARSCKGIISTRNRTRGWLPGFRNTNFFCRFQAVLSHNTVRTRCTVLATVAGTINPAPDVISFQFAYNST
jgi:hypothetical protein